MTEHDESSEAPGWDAIDLVFAGLYPEQTPRHFATVLPAFLGGRDPLQGISAYESVSERPHWHFVTYGFSELYEKDGEPTAVSGYGFELTLRLARENDQPPNWAINFLQNLGRYVFQSGAVFGVNQYMNINGPIARGAETEIEAVFFVLDPQAAPIVTPNGSVQFLQVVGATTDELETAQIWTSTGMLAMIQAESAMMITDLSRKSVLGKPGALDHVAARLAEDGSTCGVLYVDVVEPERDGEGWRLTMGAQAALSFLKILPHRLLFDKSLTLAGLSGFASFEPGLECGLHSNESWLEIKLTREATHEVMRVLRAEAGDYRIAALPALTITVVRSDIRDSDGRVERTIG